MFTVGQEIQLHGLSTVKYNGLHGVVVKLLTKSGRLKIKLDRHPKPIAVLAAHATNITMNRFVQLPKKNIVDVLKFFTIFEVASTHRFVNKDFRDAGQARIHERGGRKLFEEGNNFVKGSGFKTINVELGKALIDAASLAGCEVALLNEDVHFQRKMCEEHPNDADEILFMNEIINQMKQQPPYSEAFYIIGDTYRRGNCGEKKQQEAPQWYAKAIKLGHAGAMNDMAHCYRHGMYGLKLSYSKAVELYARAAALGQGLARANLSEFYLRGVGGLQRDPKTAKELLVASSLQGVQDGQYQLGCLLKYGSEDGLPMSMPPVSDRLFHPLFLKAAEQGSPGAQNEMGQLYLNAGGLFETVQQNVVVALEWFTKSAVQGFMNSEYMVGVIYEHGLGLPEGADPIQAVEWYTKAAAQGDQQAEEAIARLMPLM